MKRHNAKVLEMHLLRNANLLAFPFTVSGLMHHFILKIE